MGSQVRRDPLPRKARRASVEGDGRFEALLSGENQFRTLVEQSIVGIYIIHDWRFVYVNPRFAAIFGYSAEQIYAMEVADLVWPSDRELVLGNLKARFDGRIQSIRYHFRARRADGSQLDCEAHGSTIDYQGGRAVIGSLLDISERLRNERDQQVAEAALRESEERYALAAEGASDGLWDWDSRTDHVHLSPRWKAMLGYRDDELSGGFDEWIGLVHPDDRRRFRVELGGHVAGRTPHFESEHRVRCSDGSYRWMLVRGMAVRDESGRGYRLAGSQTDITLRKESEEKLLHDALHDGLTGLPNRALLIDRLTLAMARLRRREDALFAVIFVDLDHFKLVNDSLGHFVGDQLLIQMARRLEACLRPGDTVARFGGDEFILLLEDLAHLSEAELVADRVQRELAAPVRLGEQEVFTTVSLGLALARPDYERPEDVLRDADTAMYRAKDLGRGRHVVFEPGMHERIVEHLHITNALRPALERNELFLQFQPVVNLTNGKLVGTEALLRWQHPQRGVVPPAEFIPVAEETGLILAMGEWVLREACRQTRAWQLEVPQLSDLSVSVNLSTRQFLQDDLVGLVREVLEDTSLDPERLHLEITESVIMENSGHAAQIIRQLRELGVHVHLDDFGTGYSSLAYLHEFHVDALKIDRSFVSRMGHGDGVRIVRAIVNLARDLGISVIAEGAETAAQVKQLCNLSCDFAQGFFFSPPLAREAFESMVQGRRPPGRALAPEPSPAH